MAATATPYGFRPVRSLTGGNGGGLITRHYKIASGLAETLFYGDPVLRVSDGSVSKANVAASTTMLGVFLGCSYTDPSLKYKLFNKSWPTGTVASDAVAYVCDDPTMIWQIQADESVETTDIGANASMVTTEGNTSIGISKYVLDGSSPATTNTLPLRIVGLVEGPLSTAGDAFTDCLVKINVGHAMDNTLGV